MKAYKTIPLVTAFLSFAQLASAVPPKVDKAVANFSDNTLTISGSNFSAPSVTLDNRPVVGYFSERHFYRRKIAERNHPGVVSSYRDCRRHEHWS
jgi:hypothetical protein